jgi:hypothetical protein
VLCFIFQSNFEVTAMKTDKANTILITADHGGTYGLCFLARIHGTILQEPTYYLARTHGTILQEPMVLSCKNPWYYLVRTHGTILQEPMHGTILQEPLQEHMHCTILQEPMVLSCNNPCYSASIQHLLFSLQDL